VGFSSKHLVLRTPVVNRSWSKLAGFTYQEEVTFPAAASPANATACILDPVNPSSAFAPLRKYNSLYISAYPGEADHDSGMMPISIAGEWRSPSERSDAGLFHDPKVIGIGQYFVV
jgi:hypothetical protein